MKKLFFTAVLLISYQASAVHVNPHGIGEVLLVPYYTVNNGLNTLVGVTNTTGNVKAIKINIREGLNGYSVLSYNVYLGPHDTWTFAMGGYPSSADGFVGQDFAALASSDHSCAPMVNKSLQEFNPYGLVDGSDDISRGREGFIEIIEMGELKGQLGAAATLVSGVPNNCALLASAWENGGSWDINPNQNLRPATGGLMAEADIMDVSSGVNYSIPTVALADFFADDEFVHVAPTDSHLSLDAAQPIATVLTDTEVYNLSFERGVDAVSAVLMADELQATYSIDSGVEGVSEIIYTQPTRRFHVYSRPFRAYSPYPVQPRIDSCHSRQYEGVEVDIIVHDREGRGNYSFGYFPGAPQQPADALCGSVFIMSMKRVGSELEEALITQSHNLAVIKGVDGGTENGYVTIKFMDTRPLMGTQISTNQRIGVMGLPIIGFSISQYTNMYARPGVMAVYGLSHPINSSVSVKRF